MNQRIYNRAIEMAQALQPSDFPEKSYHLSFGIKKSRIVCVGQNSYKKIHPYHKWGKYSNTKNLPGEYKPSLHSEIDLCISLGIKDLSDYEILNIRLNKRGKPIMARCCDNCTNVLLNLEPKRVFYSDWDGELARDERF